MIIKDLAALEKFSQNFAKFLKSSLGQGENAEIGVSPHLDGRVAKRTSSRLRRTNDRSALGVHEDHEDDENAEIGVSPHAQDIFLLFRGGLATGKTTTISMLIKALGVNSESSSPSFMGMHEYSFPLQIKDSIGSVSQSSKNIQLYHLDLYQRNIDLDSVLELMDSDSSQIWMIEWSEKLDQEILDYLYLKHAYIKTFDIELKILEDDARNLSIRETFTEFRDSNEKEIDENIEKEVLKWSRQELN
ncbi:MAG: tRNA (adenosine(37)-N6)-threonylcarbamoyltransferase complex ATPase subunit type 1 TsaE [bacterium]